MDGIILNLGPLVWPLCYVIIGVVAYVYVEKLDEPRLYIILGGAVLLLASSCLSFFSEPLKITTALFSNYQILRDKNQLITLLATHGLSSLGILLVAIGFWRALKSLHSKVRRSANA